MNFKEQLALDNKVFLNLDEFADLHTFDGKEVTCIVDDDYVDQQNVKAGLGTVAGIKCIHLSLSELPGKPVADAIISFDGKNYTIQKVINNEGILTITMLSNQGV